jgi:hypothetical protein
MIEMTNEEIIQIAHKYLYHYDTELGQWELNEESIEDIMEFARAIRKQTIDEILTSLKEVPNPEANRTAINRIMSI